MMQAMNISVHMMETQAILIAQRAYALKITNATTQLVRHQLSIAQEMSQHIRDSAGSDLLVMTDATRTKPAKGWTTQVGEDSCCLRKWCL